jgi:hypothetical protein
MPDYKVRYKDGRTRTVPADKYARYDGAYVFDRGGEDILTIDDGIVESVGLADLPDAESPPAVFA